jgi:hypothetical protein
MQRTFWLGSMKERDNAEELRVDGMTILELTLSSYIGFGRVECFHLAPDRSRWRALMNMIISSPLP